MAFTCAKRHGMALLWFGENGRSYHLDQTIDELMRHHVRWHSRSVPPFDVMVYL